MRKELQIETRQKCWSLVTDITFSTVESWYNAAFRDLKCSICMPKVRGKERYPLLIWLCGGAFQVMDQHVWWPQWTEFARSGCVVASVEYRTTNEAAFPAALCDVKTAIRYFRTHAERYAIDPERIFVAGESAGGTLASLAGVTGKIPSETYDQGEWQEVDSSVKGVINYYGVSDPYFDGKQICPGLPGEASVIEKVSEHTPPFLIFHGDRDDLVNISLSEALYQRLCDAGVKADYYVLKGEGHGADAFYQDEIMELVKNFILQ